MTDGTKRKGRGPGRPKVLTTPKAKYLAKSPSAVTSKSLGEWLRLICDEEITYPDLTGVVTHMPAAKACAIALVAKVLTERDVRAFEVLARYVDHGGEHKLAVSVETFDAASQEILRMAGYNVSQEGRIIETEFEEVPAAYVKTPCEENPIPKDVGRALTDTIPEVAIPALARVHARKRRLAKAIESKGDEELFS